MEFAALAENNPVVQNVLHNHALMFIRSVLAVRQIILNALHIGSVTFIEPCHWYILHILHEDFLLSRISHRLLNRISLCFFQCHNSSDILVFECEDFIGVKTEYVLISDAVCNTIPVKFIAEHSRCCVHLFLVLILYRCAGEAKEDRSRKCLLNRQEHLSEG